MPESRLPAPDPKGFREIDRVRVRYAETDQMGYAYYSHAAVWFELARTGLLRHLGRTYRSIEENENLLLPVLAMHVDYHQAALYDDLLSLHARCRVVRDERERPSRLRFRMEFEVHRSGELLYEGWTLHCFIRRDTRHPVKIPAWFSELLDAEKQDRGEEPDA